MSGIKNVTINLVTIKDFAARIGKNLTWFFLACFLIILCFEVLETKNSFDIGLNLNQVLPSKIEKGVRVNFSDYQTAVDRIQGSQSFTPNIEIKKDPFGVSLDVTPKQ